MTGYLVDFGRGGNPLWIDADHLEVSAAGGLVATRAGIPVAVIAPERWHLAWAGDKPGTSPPDRPSVPGLSAAGRAGLAVADELRRNPARRNQQIVEIVGTDGGINGQSVAQVRSDLEVAEDLRDRIHVWRVSHSRVRHMPDCWCGSGGDYAPKPEPEILSQARDIPDPLGRRSVVAEKLADLTADD